MRKIRSTRKMKNKLYLSLFIGLMLSIGVAYAYLQQQLSINGQTLVSSNVWNVHFSGTGENNTINDSSSHISSCVTPEQCSVVNTHANISNDGTAVNFSVTFHIVDDYYEFYVDVVNDGTIDAMLSSFGVSGINAGNQDYLSVSIKYADDSELAANDFLGKCGGTEHIKVRVTFTNAPADDVYGSFSFTMNYVQADGNVKERRYNPAGVIKTYNTEGSTISTTDHANELRFIGANPNNYVYFNGNQKWRIIGVFDGKLKLIQDSIGTYSYDTSLVTVNNGYGVNQWGGSTLTDSSTYSGADLMKLLNPGYDTNKDYICNATVSSNNCGSNDLENDYTNELVNNSLYWNGGTGKCYSGVNMQAKTCNFSTVGLTDETSRNMIDNATWYLGSLNTPSANIWDGRITADLLYQWERSNDSGKQCSSGGNCNDTVNRSTRWTGKVGIMYPSDYAYATGGGSNTTRNECLSYTVGYVDNNNIPNWSNTYTECKDNDWLLNKLTWQWTISPRAASSGALLAFGVSTAGYVSFTYASYAGSVRPVVYLKSSVSFTGNGNGTQSNPYRLKIIE